MARDREKGGCKNLGECLHKIRRFYTDGIWDSQLLGEKTAGHMAENEDAQGGVLVPEVWADEILHAALEGSIVRSRATVIPAPSDSFKVRRVVDSDRSSSYFGGVTFSWVKEAATKADAVSKPAVGELELTLHKLVGSVWVSNELEDDFGRFGEFMKLVFGQALRFEEDDVFLNGTGGGQPQGVISAPGLITKSREQTDQIVWEDITEMCRLLLPKSWQTAIFLLNPDTLDQVLSLDANTAFVRNIVNMNDRKILGFPFIVTEKCPSLNTTGDILLADFENGHYVIADKEMRISASRHVAGTYGFVTDETFWKVVLRTDGQPLLTAGITPKRGANTLGPFVALSAFDS